MSIRVPPQSSPTTSSTRNRSPEPLLRVTNLRTYFHDRSSGGSTARAVDGVSFTVGRGETVCLVGESGSGKSVSALSILRLIRNPGTIEPGSSIEFDGRELLSLTEEEIRHVRGRDIAMIFQEPMAALNPVLTVGEQVAEVVRVHTDASKQDAWNRAIDMLALTGIPAPRERARQYPHELSGGMRQRVMIAMALVMHPALLIADEPTTALDVTIQAQILELLQDLQARLGMAILLITHDLGVVSQIADRVYVMYGGEVVEQATVHDLFTQPHHPYTQGLMRAMPQLGKPHHRLHTIQGVVPPSTAWPTGCRFRDRCEYAWDRCEREHPPLYSIGQSLDNSPPDAHAISSSSSSIYPHLNSDLTSPPDSNIGSPDSHPTSPSSSHTSPHLEPSVISPPDLHTSRCHLASEPERRRTQHVPLATRIATDP